MCGIFGMVGKEGENVAKSLYVGLYAQQHRGKESAGMATYDGTRYYSHRGMGEIAIVFRGKILEKILGNIGVAQTRYSTFGKSAPRNIQPVSDAWQGEEFWLGHNGNLVNAEELRKWCKSHGVKKFRATSDTGIIAKVLSLTPAPTFEEAVKQIFPWLRGAFSIVILYKEKIFFLRDTFGFRPLTIGTKNGAYFISSETGAFAHLKGRFVRDVKPGEIGIITQAGVQTLVNFPSAGKNFCVFEFIYFLRPDTKVFGRRARAVRERMGEFLFQEYPVSGDIVIGIPDSGEDAGRGFAKASGIPEEKRAIFRTHLTSRTFIEPVQELREQGIDLKFIILEEYVAGKRIILVDDSLVRATTLRKLIERLREAGAREIHVRISSPMYRFPCFYGIDTYRIANELAAARHGGDIEKIRKEIGADSLAYLSLQNVIGAIIETPGDPLGPFDFCAACFTGEYPVPIEIEN